VKVMKVWDSNDTQFCDGCGVYHYRDACTDAYFNDPDNWS
jgi:hypothetical protein